MSDTNDTTPAPEPEWMGEAVEAAGCVLISADEDTVRDAILDALRVAREHGWELRPVPSTLDVLQDEAARAALAYEDALMEGGGAKSIREWRAFLDVRIRLEAAEKAGGAK